MKRSTEEILALSAEAAVVLEDGRAVYANAPARALLGDSAVGKSAGELLGIPLPGGGSPCAFGELRLAGAPYAARLSVIGEEKTQVLFLSSCAGEPLILNEAFLVALRNELTSLSLCREGLAALPEPPQTELRRLLRCEMRIRRLAENASLVFRRGERSAPFRPWELDLRFLCASVMDAVAFHFPEIRFLWCGGDSLRACVDGDLVVQMLLNVISNAVQHARGCRCVAMDLRELGTRAVIGIRDDGEGMTAEQLPALFERYRFPYAVGELGGGAGLGLSAVRAVVDLHGGALLVESREGHGTNVQIALERGEVGKLREDRLLRPCTMEDLQLGLATCLDEAYYGEQWTD